jgi:diacylglycerol kinase (ATP)
MGSSTSAGIPPVLLPWACCHFGTGGDFCRTAGIARKLGAAVEALKGRSCRALDVGQVEFVDHDGCAASRYFVNVASFGLSGLVDSIVEQSSKGLGGRVGFAVATMRAMRQYRAQETELTLDDNLPQRVRIQTVAVANGQYFGGGMRIAPDAQLDDGRLDVVVVDPLSTVDLLRHGHRVYRGTHLGLPFVHHSLAEQVHARPHRSGEQIWLDVDGEALGRLPARFTLCPSALQLKCSPSPVARPFDERTPPTASGAATGASDGVPA